MNKTIVDAKEKSIIKEPKSIKAFIKKYHFAFICFLSSLPLIALGICSFLFLYHPTTQWQTNNNYWIKPFGIILFIVIIEFVIVGIPTLMINLKERKEKAEKE